MREDLLLVEVFAKPADYLAVVTIRALEITPAAKHRACGMLRVIQKRKGLPAGYLKVLFHVFFLAVIGFDYTAFRGVCQ